MDIAAPAPAKQDNMLGICHAIGEDFGFNPIYLRVALAVGLLWNVGAMFGLYLTLGVIVLASRLIFPNRKPATVRGVVPVAEGQDLDPIFLDRAA